MLEIIKPQIEVVEADENRALFSVEPLERGFGHTLGNSMRRVLLSSLPGTAITAVYIEGYEHEFQAIKGVREDYIDLILNLKGVVLRAKEPGTYEARLEGKGKGELKAGDIKLPGELEVVNPEHHIAELEKDGEIKAILRIETGRGYVSAERNKREDDPIGVIPIDAIFSPIKRVTYRVEDTRVGQRTDYDRLLLEVETNGAVTPQEAVSMAAQIIKEHMNLFEGQSDSELEGIFKKKEVSKKPVSNTPIEELELSVRPYNCLKRNGIHTIEQLLECTEEDLMNMRNFGQKSMEEIKQKLQERNLSLKSSD